MLKNIPTLSYSLEGLEHPAKILIDCWGVPHIYANSFYDAFFVQGFNAARDRLWQIDLWRRHGLGQLAEVFGPNYVEQDKASRLFLYRGDMDREWLIYGSHAKNITTAFVNGLNEYIKLVKKNPDLIPIEFKLLDYEPAFWSSEDVVCLRSHGRWRNVESEVTRAQVAGKFGLEVDAIRQQLEPEWKTKIPEGLDPCSIPEDVLHLYKLATRGVIFTRKALLDASSHLTKFNALLEDQNIQDALEGSNNWAISSRLTATGRPILANDPHRTHSTPALRYIAHLVAPNLNVIGAGEPTLPGISIGHNERIGFGLTIFPTDQEDLYVHQTNPENPNEYKYQGHWEAMEIVNEEISVLASAPVRIELKFTRYGPVIYENKQKYTAFSIRVAWLEPGMAPYFHSIKYMQAQNWEEFLTAVNQWRAPSVNQIYADIDGNIGWKAAGLVPIRPNWDGLLPVPGDGQYEWAGFQRIKDFPVEYNPSQGWLGTANQMNLPKDYPYKEHRLGFEWEPQWRYERISEVVNSGFNITLLDSLNLQTDCLSILARRLCNVLQELNSNDQQVIQALEMLKSWDYVLSIESAPAALFEVWFSRYLCPAVVSKLVSPEAQKVIGLGDTRVILSVLEYPDSRLGENPQTVQNNIILSSLKKAIQDIEKTLGTDKEKWAWGDLHRIFYEHPLSKVVNEKTQNQINISSVPVGGSQFTVNYAAYNRNDFRVLVGASWRMILDIGNWDNCFAMNLPGQSGDPFSPHYKDLLPKYMNESVFPLLYSFECINKAVEQTIELKPLSQ